MTGLRARRAGVTFLAGASLVQLASNATAAVVATMVLGPGQRGVMVIGVSIGGISAVVGGLGTGSALRARLPSCADPAARRRLLSSYAWWTAAALVIAVALALSTSVISAPLIDPALAGVGFLGALAIFTVWQVLMLQTTEAWFADGHYRRGGISAASTTAAGVAVLLLAATVSTDAGELLFAQGLGASVAWLAQLRSLRRAELLVAARPRQADLTRLVGKGAPALGLSLGLAIALRADRYLLGTIAGPAAVGVYSLAATLSEVSRLFPQTIGQFFMREVALHGGRQRLAHRVLASTAATVAAGLVIATAGWLLIVPAFGEEFGQARFLLLVLVVAEVCFAPYAVASRGLLGGGWTRTVGGLGLLAGVAAIGCYLLGARMGGSVGLATSCVVLYGGLSAAALMLFLRRTRLTTGQH
ncbi:MAG: oligosaccharide flippase family protein [Kibdelosporangium sp.]